MPPVEPPEVTGAAVSGLAVVPPVGAAAVAAGAATARIPVTSNIRDLPRISERLRQFEPAG
jgi:hypothetical protein